MKALIGKFIPVILTISLLLIGCEAAEDSKREDNLKQDIINTDFRKIKFAFRFTSGTSIQKEVFSDIEMMTSNSHRFKFDFMQYSSSTFALMHVPLAFPGARKLAESGDIDAIETNGAFHYLASNDLIKDLTSLFPEYAPQYFSSLSETELARVTYNGRIMGIPAYISGLSRYCVLAKKSLIDKYKISSLNNYNELEKFLKTIKENEPGYVPISITANDEKTFYEIEGYISPDDSTSIVYKVDDPEMKLVPWEETQEFFDCINMLKRWREEEYFIDFRKLSSRNIASYIVRADSISLLKVYERGDLADWVVFPLYPERPSVITPDAEKILAIPKNSQNAANVLMFIEWVHSSQKNYDYFMYGEAGRNYTMDNENGKLKQVRKAEYAGNICFTDIRYMRQFDTDPHNLVNFYRSVSELEEIPCPHDGFYIEENMLPQDILYGRIDLFKDMREKYYDIDIGELRQNLRDARTYELVQYMQKELDKWRERHNTQK